MFDPYSSNPIVTRRPAMFLFAVGLLLAVAAGYYRQVLYSDGQITLSHLLLFSMFIPCFLMQPAFEHFKQGRSKFRLNVVAGLSMVLALVLVFLLRTALAQSMAVPLVIAWIWLTVPYTVPIWNWLRRK